LALQVVTLSVDRCDVHLALHAAKTIGSRECAARGGESTMGRLDLTAPLYIGSTPSERQQLIHADYDGCVRDLYIDHKLSDLSDALLVWIHLCIAK
jgi:hypothetical protein